MCRQQLFTIDEGNCFTTADNPNSYKGRNTVIGVIHPVTRRVAFPSHGTKARRDIDDDTHHQSCPRPDLGLSFHLSRLTIHFKWS